MKLHHAKLDKIQGLNHTIIERMNGAKIYNILDLLELFPKKYEFFEVLSFKDSKHNQNITFKGKIISKPIVKFLKRGLSRLDFKILVDGVEIQVHAFNREFLRTRIQPEKEVFVSGKFNKEKLDLTASKVDLDGTSFKEIKPVYNVDNLKDYQITRAVANAYIDFFTNIPDDLPEELIEKYKLLTYRQAIKVAHSPKSKEELALMYRRLKYEELFKFQLKIQYLRLRNSKKSGVEKNIDEKLVKNFEDIIEFDLTEDQNDVIEDIIEDLKSNRKMNRLVQGDVGSGKTLVAAITMYLVAKDNKQSALMAPTEILAEQHYKNLKPFFDKLGLSTALLTGKMKVSDRRTVLGNLKSGKIDIIIGTHALISNDVDYKNLGYVVTDEQHRFGVDQRKMLREKGDNPDVLFMTATPIPRTLAITIFGDMDVSVIKAMPGGRLPVTTNYIHNKEITKVYDLIEKNTKKKQQTYVVVPLVDESQKLELVNTKEILEKLEKNLSKDIKIALIHGKLKPEEKDDIMSKFSLGEIDVLVSTTVIEVGVDVKNATLMIIMDAHRFGLAQLHQLRGRVGRNKIQSECYLLSDSLTERIEIMTKTNDGFEISEEDLKLRGPGDFFGSKQSGTTVFKHVNLIEDFKILESARNDASKLVHKKIFYSEPEYIRLRTYLKRNITEEEMQ